MSLSAIDVDDEDWLMRSFAAQEFGKSEKGGVFVARHSHSV